MKRVLVTGGAGYIGANISTALLEKGYEVVVVDDFSNGLHSRLEGLDIEVRTGDILDRNFLNTSMSGVDAVIHLAAKKSVEESVTNPLKYFENNVSGTINVIAAMAAQGVQKVIFSSTAVVYDSTAGLPLKESDKKNPLSPYAQSKLLSEDLLEKAGEATGMSSISLRYFNVVGAGGVKLGDNARDNLVPKTFLALKQSRNPQVYGTNYPTKDGTCIRDYIHVSDLADAHVLAMEKMGNSKESKVFNVGSGTGYSVLEMMEQMKLSTGIDFKVDLMEARTGDPSVLIADIAKVKKELGWSPRRNLKEMIDSAWAAERDGAAK
ncbi:MAG: UDP-glucose 4-epimerase GalE [Actinobacteria bacterium]|nr:UDP-glucose 4-epimerase GalE [Actinomycetota bacterium]